MSRPAVRLFVDHALNPGGVVTLDKGRSHYVSTVMRLGDGDEVLIFNGRDGEWSANLDGGVKAARKLSLQACRRPQLAGPDVWLLFAPLKKDRTDYAVEKATELGAARILPTLTARTQGSRINRERLQATAIEAAEQSDRLDVPDIDDARPLAERLANWPAGRTLIFLDETGGGRPLADVLKDVTGGLAFLIGPEGGFQADELDGLRNLPFAVAADLGPRVLRAETAAAAALAVRQAISDGT
ncbi:MAG: 16S rRNA (uracil(1498)-N(3))-methyltransferase [Proteobacteria bacterium]|nr:16S rRNA (uracil(1498)-N(3))-methyltransferase [Pseudomonadota bacterium]